MKYFAFGSNMNKDQMIERVGQVPEPMPVSLKGYKLVFNKWASSRGCCAANMIKTDNPRDIVEGVMYELTDDQIKLLDKNEGYDLTKPYSAYSYRRQVIPAISQGGEVIRAATYIADKGTNQREHKPNLAYMENLLAGKNYYSENYYNQLLNQALSDGGTARSRLNICLEPVVAYAPVFNRQPNEIEEKFLQGQQLGALYALTATNQRITKEMTIKSNDPVFQGANKKTCAVFKNIIAYHQLAPCAHLSLDVIQQNFEKAISQGQGDKAMCYLANGAKFTDEMALKVINDRVFQRNYSQAAEELKPFALAFLYHTTKDNKYYRELKTTCDAMAARPLVSMSINP